MYGGPTGGTKVPPNPLLSEYNKGGVQGTVGSPTWFPLFPDLEEGVKGGP